MPALLESSSSLADDFEMLCAADYPAEEVQWLWPGRIPIGKVTLLVGDPGNGKSLVALDIVSRVSRGGAWPDDQVQSQETRAESQKRPSGSRLPGSVLILSAEDDIRDTIRPRLDAAGADPQRVFILPAVADLRHDLGKLRAALDRLPDCRLIVIDPVNSYVGPGDSHFHTIVRRVFEPLTKLATERGIAILGVSHLRKHDGAAIQRAAGSMGFVAAARAVWTVCRDPVQAGRYLLLQVKNNFVAEAAGLAYSISSRPPLSAKNTRHKGPSVPVVSWQVEPVTTSAVEAMQPDKKSRGPEPAELMLAMDFVQGELATGPKAATWMLTSALGGGFNDRTVRRALVAIGGKARKMGPFGNWVWYLPDHDFQDIETAASEQGEPANAAIMPASPFGHQCAASTEATPDKSPPGPSENLSPSRKNVGSPQETCPLREKTTNSEFMVPQLLPQDELVNWHRADLPETARSRKPEHVWTLLVQKFNEDCFVPYEYHEARMKLYRLIKTRSRRHSRTGIFKRVEVDHLKPHIFRHPKRSRAP